MKRSHRIVRELHANRVKRRERAADVVAYDHVKEAEEVAVNLRALERDGLCDPAIFDDFEDGLGALIKGYLARYGEAFREVAADDVAERLFGGKTYRNRLDRQLAVASSAVAACMVEEHVIAVAFEVVRELAEGFHHEKHPAAIPVQGPEEWGDADIDPDDGAYARPGRFTKREAGAVPGQVAPAGSGDGETPPDGAASVPSDGGLVAGEAASLAVD